MTFPKIIFCFLVVSISWTGVDARVGHYSHSDNSRLGTEEEATIQTERFAKELSHAIDVADSVTLKIQFAKDTEDVSVLVKTDVPLCETSVVVYDMPFDSFPESEFQDEAFLVTLPIERGVLHTLAIRQRSDSEGIAQYELYDGDSPDPSMLRFRDSSPGRFQSNYFIIEKDSAPTPSPTTAPPSGFGCFPGDALVQEKSKGLVQMKNLELGDQVQVSPDRFEAIYSFGHKDSEISMEYVRLRTANSHLEITKEHMLFVADGRVIPASMVKVGDKVVLSNNQVEIVNSVSATFRNGAYAPFTPSGSIVVNGIKASTFIALQDSEHLTIGGLSTQLSHQWLAHTFEGPHRFWCGSAANVCDRERYIDGISVWVYYPHKVARWLVTGARMDNIMSPFLRDFGVLGWLCSLGCVGVLFFIWVTKRAQKKVL